MKWILPPQKVSTAIQEYILQRRQIEDVEKFLNPTHEHIHAYGLLFDTGAAADAILAAIADGKKIFIHGDFDVDGVCATAIMWDFLYRELGADVTPYIPSRFDEGYGISPKSLDQILEQGGQLVISVDCGVKNIEEVAEYIEKGLEFVITDHHTLPEDSAGEKFVSSEALAVVHPKHPQGSYPFPEICGSMVSWKVCQAVAAKAELGIDMNRYLELVALATVCDVMPLVDENRVAVALGLQRLKKTESAGLRALLELASIKPADIQTYHLGFVIGPRLNAAGRLDSAMDALRLLTTKNPAQAKELAAKLEALNAERQQLTQDLIAKAEAQVEQMAQDQRLIFVYGEDWPEGIVGLVAGKLAEKYNRPVLVGSSNGEVIKGSARSQGNFHVADVFKQIDDLLVRHGGHAQAAGFTLSEARREDFTAKLLQLATKMVRDEDLEKKLEVDVLTDPESLTLELAEGLLALEPFGFSNPTPIFAFQNVTITDRFVMGSEGQHLKLRLGPGLEVVAFRAQPEWLALQVGDVIDVAGTIEINQWNGRRSVQMIVKDIKVSDVGSQLPEESL